MKSYVKQIRFENIQLKVDKQHPKDISRVHLKIIQESHQQHKTKKYGNVLPNQITWQSPIQFKYLAQPLFKFQTICQHQYGYELSQLKALYYGQIKLRPQDFFHINKFTVYNKNNQKCGRIQFMIKVIDREVGIKYNQGEMVENKDRIRVDLVARINVFGANLLIYPLHVKDYHQNTKNHYQLQIKIDGTYMKGIPKDPFNWKFKQAKVELSTKSDHHLRVRIMEADQVVLDGKLQISTLLKNKRFSTQTVELRNSKKVVVGFLEVDMRIMQKKQILDLMYSPKKLEDIKMQQSGLDQQYNSLTSSQYKLNQASQPLIKLKRQRISLNLSSRDKTVSPESSRLVSPQNSPLKKNKYELYFRKKYQDAKFSQQKRFSDNKNVNPYVSYIGQDFGSDFSRKGRIKSIDITASNRTDFTKQFKQNPGIGQYHLPSIWQRV